MPSAYVVREAQPNLIEATAVWALEHQSLCDSRYTPEEICQVMGRPDHHTYVVAQDETLVGFCSCLDVPGDRGIRREIDMLGVAPAHRGRGLATRLIRYAIAQALAQGIASLRAIAAVDNVPSRRALQRAGLIPIPQPYDLLVYEIHGLAAVPFLPTGWRWHIERLSAFAPLESGARPFVAVGSEREGHRLLDHTGNLVALAECVQVQTLAYRGLWLENVWAASDLAWRALGRAAVEHAKRLTLDEVGYLSACAAEGPWCADALAPLLREGYQVVGRYLVFTFDAV